MPISDSNQPSAGPDFASGGSGERSAGESSVSRTLSSLMSTPQSRARRWAVRGVIFATMALLLGTLSLGWVVQRSMRELAGKSISTVLAANAASVDLWLQQRRDDAERLAQGDLFRQNAIDLLDEFGDRTEWDVAEAAKHPAADKLVHLNESLLGDHYLGWVLLDSRSRVVGSSHQEWVGELLPIPSDVMPRLIQSQTTVSRPFKSTVSNAGTSADGTNESPLMIATAPISDGARLIGALGLMIDPLGEFSDILQVARLGESGETYAFDRDGLMLSRSRFEDELWQSGLLPDGTTSVVNTYVREPDVDIRVSKVDPSKASQAKLTWMADQATRGATGSSVTGYRNYRGVNVIGSWSWNHEYEMGIAAEVEYDEAYAPMQILTRAFYGLSGLISLIGIGLVSGLSVVRWFGGKAADGARKLGQYELGSVVGRGGMGAVYRGRHELLDRDVAIKVLERTEVTPRTFARFEREVRMTARLRHPNTIDVYDYGRTGDGTFFYVMEFVDGLSLQELVKHYGRQPAERVIYLLLQICGSLSEAHKQSLVHRDVKPANVLLTTQAGLYDMVKVLDFGLVKKVHREATQLTQNSAITGTPLYMSPESVRDASQANPQSDVYSVGAVGYFLLTGLPTFDGDSAADICVKQLHQQPVRCDERIGQSLPDDLQNILMSCLRKDASERPVSMDELAEALLQCSHAHVWTPADACQWWEQVYDGPRDEHADFADTYASRPDQPARNDSTTEDSVAADDDRSDTSPQSITGKTTQ